MSHDFSSLYVAYPATIQVMPSEFNSHEFIERLAQRNQSAYIEALNTFKIATAPFRQVHAVLSQHLHQFTSLIVYDRHKLSPDIFGDPVECAVWKKVSVSNGATGLSQVN